MSVFIPVAWGELIDKITILEIKSERISAPEKLKNVRKELEALKKERDQHLLGKPSIEQQHRALKEINEKLWEIEDDIRICEQKKQFDQKFINLARAVYVTNDQRAAVKRQINEVLGSDLCEEKDYVRYDAER